MQHKLHVYTLFSCIYCNCLPFWVLLLDRYGDYRSECYSWMVANPAKRISFFNIAAIFGRAFLKTASSDKAVRGFEVCGLWPFNENVFTEEDFEATEVTEEPQPIDQHKDGESQTQPNTHSHLRISSLLVVRAAICSLLLRRTFKSVMLHPITSHRALRLLIAHHQVSYVHWNIVL